MGVEINESIIKNNTKARPGKVHTKKWIVIHETGNNSSTANAKNHSIFLSRIAEEDETSLSWHYTVDENEIYHHVPDDEIAWHAGDGVKEEGGNYSGIGIEICVNDGSNLQKSRDNAAWLVANLMKEHGFTIDAVQQHNYFSGKNCPQIIREQGLWDDFIENVKKNYSALNNTSNDNNSNSDNNGTTKPSTQKFAVGETVSLTGPLYINSLASATGKSYKNLICKITRVVDMSRKAPYLINDGLGWVKESDLSKVSSGTIDTNNTGSSGNQSTSKTIKVGDKVSLTGPVYVDSLASKKGKTFNKKICVVSKITDTARKAPYLLDDGLGWARKGDLTLVQSAPSGVIREGSKVSVNGMLYTNSYGNLGARNISGIYTVSLVIDDRKAGILLNKNLGWVRKEDCKLI